MSLLPKYPNVIVQLSENDGNANFIIARCRSAAIKAGLPTDTINQFIEEAKSGDYENLIQTCFSWFSIE